VSSNRETNLSETITTPGASTTPGGSAVAKAGWQTGGDVRLFWAGDERLEAALDELAAMAAAEPPRKDFAATLLESAATAVDAVGAALWVGEAGAPLALVRKVERGSERANRFSGLAGVVEEAFAARQARVVHLSDGPANVAVLLCPWRVSLGTSGVVGIAIRDGLPAEVRQSAEQFAQAIAIIAADHFRNVRLHELSAEQGVWRQFEEFTLALHPSNEVERVASAIVNEGRRLVEADRLSLAVSERGSYRAIATSGVTVVNRRGNLSRRMEELCGAVAAADEPLWRPCDGAIAPQIEAPLERYLEESHARTIAVVPLRTGVKPTADEGSAVESATLAGVLIAEWFEMSDATAAAKARLSAVCRQSEAALAHVMETDRLPFVGLNRRLAKVAWLVEAKQWPRTKIWAGAVLAVIALFAICPAGFEVEADGELQPAERRELFAPMDGVVQQALVDHGAQVKAGQLLARLRSPALELEMARVNGERQTAEKRFAAVRTARLELDQDGGGEASSRYLQLTAEEEEIKQLLASLARQSEILERQQRDLEVTSPIDGQVLTWDAQRELANRPVERGQSLLSVGNIAGSWVVELHVPDDEVGYVLAEHAEAIEEERPAVVSFILASDPGVRRRGEIERIAMRSSVEGNGHAPSVTVTVRVNEEGLTSLRPGTSVMGKIDCGWRSLGFVWFHRAWNAVRRRVFF
jgi:multidrug efflux pump subunit AcrA (membrane-fusion protein)